MTTASTAARAPASTPARGAAMEERAAATAPAAFPLAAEDAAGLPSRAAADRDAAQLRRRWAERMTGRPPFPRPLRAEPPAFFPRPRAVARGCGTLFELAALRRYAPGGRARVRGGRAPAPRAASGGRRPRRALPGRMGGGSGGLLPGARRAAPPRPGRRRRPPSVLPRRALALRAARVPLPRGRPARAGARRRAGGAVGPGDALELVRVGQLLHGGVRGRPREAREGAARLGGGRRPRAPPHAERPAPCGLERVPPRVELLGGAEARLAAPRATVVHLRHPRA